MSLGNNHKLSTVILSGAAFPPFLILHASCILSVRALGEMRYSSIRGNSSPLSLVSKSYAVRLTFFFSTPNDVAQLPCGSKSISNTLAGGNFCRFEPFDSAAARLTAVVVFAQPPF